MSADMPACVACGSRELESLVGIARIPTFCNKLQPSASSAKSVIRGDLDLRFCRRCAHVFNAAFDPALMQYDEGYYDTSLHASGHFRDYAERLADDLVARHGLVGKRIVEIGSGRAEFLKLLAEKGDNEGIGFDPSGAAERVPAPARGSIDIVPEYFGAGHKDLEADFVVCRHVLEHVERPVEFLSTVAGMQAPVANAGYYFEVPNALYTLRDLGIWDLIYEHVSFFTPTSAALAFRAAGLGPAVVAESFGGQYLGIENAAKERAAPVPQPDASDIDATLDLARCFAERFERKMGAWRQNLARWRGDGRKVVLWGAGSKGVTFLNLVDPQGQIGHIVDLNTAKHGRFVPGTGQEIVPPAALRPLGPDIVVILNPNYQPEIGQLLGDLDVESEILVA